MVKELLLAQINREIDRSRRALEHVPDGKFDWKPHEKSMNFGYLAYMVATIPSWIARQLTSPDLDLAPAEGSSFKPEKLTTSAELIQGLEKSAAEARRAFDETSDQHLATNWQLKVKGAVVQEGTRQEMIHDTIAHWAHHRGQMTVYLRLMGAKVPALYGPSADERTFG